MAECSKSEINPGSATADTRSEQLRHGNGYSDTEPENGDRHNLYQPAKPIP
jgi:hypothetical protein